MGPFAAEGHIISLQNSDLDIEVSCILDVHKQAVIMADKTELASDLVTTAIEKAFADEYKESGSHKPFVKLLLGKAPTLSDIQQRAERVRPGTAAAKKKAADEDSSSNSGSDSAQVASDIEDNDCEAATAAASVASGDVAKMESVKAGCGGSAVVVVVAGLVD